MAINFPDTTNKPTDGSFTHDHLNNTWVWGGVSWSIQNIISTYTNFDVDVHLNNTGSTTNGQILSWDTTGNGYTWVDQGNALSNISDTSFGVDVPSKMQVNTIDLGSGGMNTTVGSVLDFEGTTINFSSTTITGDTVFNGIINNHIWSGSTKPSDGYVLSWNSTLHSGDGDYEWVAQSTGGTQYANSDVDTHLNQTGSITDGYVLSWDDSADGGSGDYAWVAQSTGGTQYANSDVDTHLNKTSTSGYILSWDQTLNGGLGDYAWIPNVNQTLGIIPTPPSNGHVLSWDTSLNGNQGGYAWTAQSSGGGSSVSISDSAPSNATSGDLWWDSDNGNLKIYYADADSSQWVDAYTTEASSGGGGSSSSSSITDGTSTLSFDSNNSISIDTHIIPDTNAAYDLGNAEYKIRHLFLSDNSLWIGDGHKIDTSDGTFKTRKRKKNTVPSSVIEAYKTSTGNSSATLQEVAGVVITWLNSESYSVTSLNEITLDMWIKYLNYLDSTKDNVEDLYPPEYINDSENINYKFEDYDEIVGQKQEGKLPASITTEDNGFYNLILFKSKRMVIIDPTSSISVNVIGAEPIDGNTVEFTVYIKQLDPAQEITGLQIDGLQVSQLRSSLLYTNSNINNPIPSPNQVNICNVKAVCIGAEWFATIYYT